MYGGLGRRVGGLMVRIVGGEILNGPLACAPSLTVDMRVLSVYTGANELGMETVGKVYGWVVL